MQETIPNLVSTIIPVYNRPEMIQKAVNSVLGQTYRPIEIIIINDGSTDDTPNVLHQIASKHQKIIRVIHKENEGPGLAREAGRLIARGEFIQYLDSDDWLLPNKFVTQVKALRENPGCDIAYGKSRFIDESGYIIREPSKWTGRKYKFLFPAILIDRWWHTHTPLYKRSISDAAGSWPKRRPEDWDLEARMGALRARLTFCNEFLSIQLAHSSGNRVSTGPRTQYILDEAWFLPRLYKCALKAGVQVTSPEMRHFSRRAFLLARQLGDLERFQKAHEILMLAKRASFYPSPSIFLYLFGTQIVGWRKMYRYSIFYSKLFKKNGKYTLADSWSN